MPSKKIHAPFIGNGNKVLCSRCFSPLKEIEKYGCDEEGFWFIAPCSRCGAKMRWYRQKDGTAYAEETASETENSFSFDLENGEIVMKTE